MNNRLTDIREENDLTQDKMGEITNVTRTVISKWENGKEIIPLEHLNTYSNYFEVSLDYLLGLSNRRNYNNIINKDLDLKLIGSRIKKFREDNNLTLRQLAEILNTSSSTISAYETGKTLILTSFAYQICKKYKISLDWLCGKIQ